MDIQARPTGSQPTLLMVVSHPLLSI